MNTKHVGCDEYRGETLPVCEVRAEPGPGCCLVCGNGRFPGDGDVCEGGGEGSRDKGEMAEGPTCAKALR